MEFSNFTFLILLIALFVAPLFFTFTGKLEFHRKLRYAVPAIFISGIVFLLWDIKFTNAGIWSYSNDYILGIYHKGLPLEEWLFYLLVPYTSLFLYEMVKSRFVKIDLNNVFLAVGLVLVIAFAIIAYLYRARIYTFFVFLFTTIYLGYTIFRKQFKPHLTHFFLTYFLVLIPFLFMNGILTWNLAIEYHQEQVLNIWFWMIPIENLVYLFLLMLINTTVYEYLSERRFF